LALCWLAVIHSRSGAGRRLDPARPLPPRPAREVQLVASVKLAVPAERVTDYPVLIGHGLCKLGQAMVFKAVS